MGRIAEQKSAIQVKSLSKPGMHFVGGAPGLALNITENGGKSWILRVTVAGKRRDIGLGSFADVSLADAREAARDMRKKIRDGIDPVQEKRTQRSALAASRAKSMTFTQCAEAFITSKEAGWKGDKHAAGWRSTLTTYAGPVIGSLNVADVELAHIMKILEKDNLWTAKPETADRVRGRIEAVLSWAAVRGLRTVDNPARWRGHLDKLLPKPGDVSKTKHQPALPYAQVADFMKALRKVEGMGARALEFAILTAARSGEVRGATWQEIDMEGRVWIVPAERMKMKKEHRVPLSDAAVTMLQALPKDENAASPHVFPAPRGGAISDMTISAVCRRMNEGKQPTWTDPKTGDAVVPHGFRSTFRDWVAEQTTYPREMAELALAHRVGTEVEIAYRRSDLFERRRGMMQEWARHCEGKAQAANVVELSAKAAA